MLRQRLNPLASGPRTQGQTEHEDRDHYRKNRGNNAERSECQSSPDDLVKKAAKAGDEEKEKEDAAAHVEMEFAPLDRSAMIVKPKQDREKLSSAARVPSNVADSKCAPGKAAEGQPQSKTCRN